MKTACERTPIILDRKGIQRIEQFDAAGQPAPPYDASPVFDLLEFTEGE